MSAPETKFSVSPKIIVAFIEHRGSYDTINDSMRDLKDWIDRNGIEQSGYPFCMYYDNPTETPQEELRSEACIPVSKPFQPEGRFQMKELQQVDVAETRHNGPPEQFPKTYGPFLEGLIKGGYQLLGPVREYYTSVGDAKGPGTGFLIQQPVAKK